MEFTPELLAFQGVLISADSAQSFSTLTERGGNEDKIKYVVDCVLKHLLNVNYITENGIPENAIDKMRKFAFYIILNSDLRILNELIELEDIDAFIWTVPTISQNLMCEIMWKAQMDEFITEILIYSSPHLVLHVADAFLTHFKYFQPDECLKRLQLLSEACYTFICRLHFFIINDDIAEHAYNNLQKCLKYFIEIPNIQNIFYLAKGHQYIYFGKRLYTILTLIRNVVNIYTKLLKFQANDAVKIYESTHKEGIVMEELESVNISQSSNEKLKLHIDNSHVALLDTCKRLMMDVSVEVFCAWSEYLEKGVTLQHNIGTLCAVVYPMLSKLESVPDHPIIEMLQQIAIKPVNLIDIINETDSITISENIDKKDEDSIKWIKALIHRNNLCEDVTLIKHISYNLKLFTFDECKQLFGIVYDYIKVNMDEDLKILAIKLFERCEKCVKEEITEKHFDQNFFNNSLEIGEFNNMSTEIFNKLIDSSVDDLSEILNVFIQNPKKTFTKIFSLAIESSKQAEIMIKVTKYLEKYSTYYYNEEIESSITIISKETIENKLDTEKKQHNFVSFIKGLKRNNIIPGSKLLLIVIMPNLHSALLQKNYKIILLHCKFLLEIYEPSEFPEYKAPILAMLAQIMEVVRCTFTTFDADVPSTLYLAITIQTNIMKEYNSIPEKEKLWLRQKLKNTTPLNMFYFRQIWQPPGNNYVEVVSGIRLNQDTDKEQLQVWVTQVLCRTIVQEWYEIWDSLSVVYGNERVLNIFQSALNIVIISEEMNRTPNTEACLYYCLECFILILRYRFLKQPVNIKQIKMVIDKLLSIENGINVSNMENVVKLFLPIFGFVAQQSNKYSRLNSEPDNDFTANLYDKLKHKEFKDMWKKMFLVKSAKYKV